MAAKRKVVGRLELIDRVHSRQDVLRHDEIKTAVDIVLGTMANFLCENDRIEIRGFGSFTLRRRPERMGRNPRTGEVKLIAARYTPHFKPSQLLSKAVKSVELPGDDSEAEDKK